MTSIFVAKLDFGVTSEQLRKLFEQYGKVLKANVATDRETGKSRGFAFVEMPDREEALHAIKSLDNFIVNGRSMTVKEAEARENSFVPPPSDVPIKSDPRKKLNKDKKTIDSESGNRNKKPKMDAYKKSGKSNRFFDDDDDDFDEDLFSYKKQDEDEDFIDDQEEDEDF